MTVVAYPHITPQGPDRWIEPELRSNTKPFASPTTGTVRTLQRIGSRWAFHVVYRNLSAAKAAALEGCLSACDGQANRFYMPIWCRDRRGSGFGSELFSNGNFANGTTGWTVDADGTGTASDYVFRITQVNGGSQTDMSQTENITINIPYLLRSVIHDGLNSSGAGIGPHLDLGTADSGTTGYTTDRGLRYLSGICDATTMSQPQYPLVLPSTSGMVADDYAECSFASFARCALVNGASQTGSALAVDNLPTSTNGLLERGDWIQFILPNGEQLARVTSRLNSDSSGGGYLQFEPQLRESPADDAPIAVTNPLGRFMLDDNGYRATYTSEGKVDIEFTAVEDITQ